MILICRYWAVAVTLWAISTWESITKVNIASYCYFNVTCFVSQWLGFRHAQKQSRCRRPTNSPVRKPCHTKLKRPQVVVSELFYILISCCFTVNDYLKWWRNPRVSFSHVKCVWRVERKCLLCNFFHVYLLFPNITLVFCIIYIEFSCHMVKLNQIIV